MGACLIKQTNGKLARYSTIVEDITDYDMTPSEYIEVCKERFGYYGVDEKQIIEDAEWVLKNNVRTFAWLKDFRCEETLEEAEGLQELIQKGYFKE